MIRSDAILYNEEFILNDPLKKLKIAVLLPCYNEGLVIRSVVENFRSELPNALIYVYDNRSSDNTYDEAKAAGAIVRREQWPGKGNVVRRMFSDIDADIYVMADGDGTYDCSMAVQMIKQLLDDHLDMVVGIGGGLVGQGGLGAGVLLTHRGRA